MTLFNTIRKLFSKIKGIGFIRAGLIAGAVFLLVKKFLPKSEGYHMIESVKIFKGKDGSKIIHDTDKNVWAVMRGTNLNFISEGEAKNMMESFKEDINGWKQVSKNTWEKKIIKKNVKFGNNKKIIFVSVIPPDNRIKNWSVNYQLPSGLIRSKHFNNENEARSWAIKYMKTEKESFQSKAKRLMERFSESWKIEDVKDILKNRQAVEIEGQVVDVQTANAVIKVFNELNPENQRKAQSMSLKHFIDFSWKKVK